MEGSDTPLRCLSDYLLDGHHSKRYEHTQWSKFYLKFHEQHKRSHLFRPLVSIAHHSGVSEMLLKSEGLFNTALTMIADVRLTRLHLKLLIPFLKNQTVEKPLCEYYFAEMVAKIDKREAEAEGKQTSTVLSINVFTIDSEMKRAAREKVKLFPSWHQWLQYLALPKLKMWVYLCL